MRPTRPIALTTARLVFPPMSTFYAIKLAAAFSQGKVIPPIPRIGDLHADAL